MSAHRHLNSFNAGEISPLMDARVDSEKYRFSCRRLENFIPRIYGGAFSRPGTEYLGEVLDDGHKVRLIPFNYSTTTRFILELGHEYIGFWSNGLRVLVLAAESLASPFTEDEIFDVQFVQLNDVCYLTHPNHPPQKLVRIADQNWTLKAVEWAWPCFGDQNSDNITATCSVTAAGATGTITFYLGFFDGALSNWVGRHIQIAHRRTSSSVSLSLGATGTSSSVRVLGGYNVFSYGTWTGSVRLQRQRTDGSEVWETLRSWDVPSGASPTINISYSGTQLTESPLRIDYTRTSSTGTPTIVLEAADSLVYGIVKITSPGDSSFANIKVIKAVHSTDATRLWALEAWSKPSGYPRSVTFHEQRLFFGGTASEPNAFWGSTVGDFENFQRTGYDDSSLAFTLAATEGSAIQGMVSQRDLMIFTQSEEWRVSTSENTVITPSNIFVRRQSRYGSAFRQPFVANQSILFVQRGARKVREFVYSDLEETSNAPDLTLLAEHVTKGGIRQMAFQQQPDPVLWVVTGEGALLSMTFERDQNVVGWSRHPTAGTVESIAIIYGDEGESDELWMVCNRSINGADVRYVERLDPEAWVKFDDLDTYRSRLIYSDCAKVITQPGPATIFAGLDHLEGATVSILADGMTAPDATVANGQIVLATPATTAVVGLPYTAVIQPAKTEIELPDGTSQGRKWLCRRLVLNLWNTLGIEYADDPDAVDWFPLELRSVATPMNESEPLFTGEVDCLNFGTHSGNVNIAIRQTKPLPANVRAIVAKFDVHGD